MKRQIISLVVAIVLAGFIMLPAVQPAEAAENRIKIDQVYTNLPEIAVVFHCSDSGEDDVDDADDADEAGSSFVLKYEDKSLEYDLMTDGSEIPREITFLIDVSTSMNEELLDALKGYLTDLYKNKGMNDVFRLVTMGENKEVVLKGSESGDDAAAAINQLKADSDRSIFWSPIKEELDFLRGKTDFARRAILVFTDGAEFRDGGETSYNEITSSLETGGIPVYAFAMNSTKSNADFLGVMARKTHGDITLVQAKEMLSNELDKTIEYLSDGCVITAKTRNLMEKDGKVVLAKENDRDECTVRVRVADDQTPPQIESIEWHDNKITIKFSEPVLNADSAQAYEVRKDKNEYRVEGVLVGANQEVVDIILEKPLYNGSYTVTAKGIVDISARSNPLTEEPIEFTIDDQPYNVKAFLADSWIYLLVAVVICAGVLATILLYRRKKKVERIQLAESRVYAGQRSDRVRIEAAGGKDIVLSISGRNLVRRSVRINVADTIIIGRLASCDVSIDDAQVSRQNTALIYKNNKLYVRNLSETNGTMLNGIALQEVRELQSGDTLIMGDTKIVVNY